MAIKAIKTVPTMKARCIPSIAPLEAASIIDFSLHSVFNSTTPEVSGWPSSGQRILERTKPAGAPIMEAVMMWGAHSGPSIPT